MLPVEAHTTALTPSSAALEIAMVIPRSLNEPVGLAPSSFNKTLAPTRSDSRGAGSSGVLPSSRVTTGVASDDREELPVLLDALPRQATTGGPLKSRAR